MEIQKHTSEQPVEQRRSQKETFSYVWRTLWDAVTAVLRGKFILINDYIKISQINNLSLHIKDQKREETTSKFSRKSEVEIRAEIMETLKNS